MECNWKTKNRRITENKKQGLYAQVKCTSCGTEKRLVQEKTIKKWLGQLKRGRKN